MRGNEREPWLLEVTGGDFLVSFRRVAAQRAWARDTDVT
jgi:hypothetical protein